MKHTIYALGTLCLLLMPFYRGTAQENFCGTGVPGQQWENKFQELIQQNKQNDPNGRTEATVYTIPVIIHVVHTGQAVGTYPNLAAGQLNSQIQVLNNDYAGVGLNTGNYPSQAFVNWATAESLPAANTDGSGRVKIANCNVQFCLATKDTLGNLLAEPGIERINCSSRSWTNPYTFTTSTTFQNYINTVIKPQSIWNVSKYLNIWVTDENINAPGIGGLLGYATFPPLSGLTGLPSVGTNITDGFWCYAKAFGSAVIYPNGNYYSTSYNKGRTCTHEIGHWLGLRHIWGDGNCYADYCSDTPPAANANAGTPTYPFHVGTCTGNSPDGEMYMNFMDYTNDNGKYMFTPDQAARMQTAMTSSPYRKFMGTHGLCSVASVAATSNFSMNATACQGASVALNNVSFGTPAPSYSWSVSGGATFIPNTSAISPSISFAAPGVYTITLAADNGTTSSTSHTIIINSVPQLILSPGSQTYCSGERVSITGSGANFYSWSPGGATGITMSYSCTTGVANFTCTASGTNGCKAKGYVTVTALECTGISKQSESQNNVRVFPNPASDRISLHADGGRALTMELDMADITGKTIMRQAIVFTKDKPDVQLDLTAFENGIYLLKLTSKEGTQVIRLVKGN